MAASEAEIEALALGAMRAWVAGDAKAMKKLTVRDFMCMVGTKPPQLLDRPSFLAAMTDGGFACRQFTFREVLVRAHGRSAWFVAAAELKLALGREAWEGQFLVSDLWQRKSWGKYRLTERSIAVLDPDEGRAAAIRRLQLWHSGGRRR